MTQYIMTKTIIQHVLAASALLWLLPAEAIVCQTTTNGSNPQVPDIKTESFNRDPGWPGVNNRAASTRVPVTIRQDFGFSAKTGNSGGDSPGEMGGYISPAGEAAFYGNAINPTTLIQPLTASGTMLVRPGGTHLLLGFFNSGSVNEWRTPNTIAIRINARGEHFFAYVEYCTSRWRAGGDTTPFPSVTDPKTGRSNLIGFPCNKSIKWTLTYDPVGSDGKGVVTATIGQDAAICKLEGSHRSDGATYNRFGIMNVTKSADTGSEVWFDDIAIGSNPKETFDKDPHWVGRNNRQTVQTKIVRPWFNFGFSNTNFAHGKSTGELGGQIFRGDCRFTDRMASYGDRLGPLTLEKPLKAFGKVVMMRGVSDSTTIFGFYNSIESMRQNESQNDSLPESVVGIQIEGPSNEGFLFYPVLRVKGLGSKFGRDRGLPIYPDGKCHDWTMEYKPKAAGHNARISVTLDAKSVALDMEAGDKIQSTTFDRFGIVTSWIDGNSQDVYWDDLSYTIRQE
jgi:hypothetical protein